MEKKSILLKKPLVVIFLCIIVASIIFYYGISIESGILLSLLVTFFYFFELRKEMILFLLFVPLGLLINFLYYNIDLSNVDYFTVTVKESYYGEYVGSYKSRKISIKAGGCNLQKGKKYVLSGDFKKELDKSKGIIGTLEVKSLQQEKNDIGTYLFQYREDLYGKISRVLDNENAALISGVSFGYVDGLTKEQKDYMKYYGLIHIISISGFHMALIYKLLNKCLDYKITLVLCIIYCIFTGASPSTIRALFMIIILKLGERIYRNYDPVSALSLAGILICIVAPYNVLNLGFQLSFLATVSIILFNKPIDKKLYRLPKYIREGIAISISPQILTYPFVGTALGYLSLNVVLSNLFLMPLFTLLVVLGNLLLILSVWDRLFEITAKICGGIGFIINALIYTLDNVTFNLIPIEREVVYFYVICLGSLMLVYKGFERIKKVPLFLLLPMAINIYSPFRKIDINNGKDIRVSYRGEINKYVIENDNIKAQVGETGKSSKVSIDKIYLEGEESYITLSKGVLVIRTLRNEIYCFSLNENKDDYDIIKLHNSEKIFIIDDKVISF